MLCRNARQLPQAHHRKSEAYSPHQPTPVFPGVNGGQLREVSLPRESPRGGFVAQILGLEPPLVLRGVWFSSQKASPNIPAVEPDATRSTSMRIAPTKPLLDPPELGELNPIGGWREIARAIRPAMLLVS